VPTSAEDFHGDGSGSQVCIIGTNRLLGESVDAGLPEPDLQELLCSGYVALLDFSAESDLAFMLERERASTHNSMAGFSHFASFLWRHLRLSDADAFRKRTNLDSVSEKEFSKRGTCTAEAVSNLLDCLSSDVAPDKIVRVSKREFCGQVYNLHTKLGWYIASNSIAHTGYVKQGGIVIHNCYTTTVLTDFPDVSAPSKEAAPDGMNETQATYYAEKYDDPAARSWLAARK
jgi:hypothetical protein